MIKDNIIFHNVDELEETKLGWRLHRYKKSVSAEVNPQARDMNRYACGCEMRFKTDAPKIKLTIYSDDDYGDILVFCGDNMLASYRVTKAGYMTITALDHWGFKDLGKGFFDGEERRFSKNVWRIYFHSFRCTVAELDTFDYPVMLPDADELPKKTLLSYGSSISHGSATLFHPNSYPQTFARLAKMDCLTKGTGGSCRIDKAVVDDFAARDDWDIGLFELGINMIGSETDFFAERFNYLVDKMVATGKKLIFVTMFPCGVCYDKNEEKFKRYNEFNDVIRKRYETLDKEQCFLVEGSEILTSTTWLMCDNIHPSTEGHVMMGINLYNKCKDFIEK